MGTPTSSDRLGTKKSSKCMELGAQNKQVVRLGPWGWRSLVPVGVWPWGTHGARAALSVLQSPIASWPPAPQRAQPSPGGHHHWGKDLARGGLESRDQGSRNSIS